MPTSPDQFPPIAYLDLIQEPTIWESRKVQCQRRWIWIQRQSLGSDGIRLEECKMVAWGVEVELSDWCYYEMIIRKIKNWMKCKMVAWGYPYFQMTQRMQRISDFRWVSLQVLRCWLAILRFLGKDKVIMVSLAIGVLYSCWYWLPWAVCLFTFCLKYSLSSGITRLWMLAASSLKIGACSNLYVKVSDT